MKRIILLLMLAVIMGGCTSNGFTNFYSGMTFEQLQAVPWYITDDSPMVGELPNKPVDAVINEMYAAGYAPIGISSWEGPSDNGNEEAVAQARKIGAAYVLWRADYSHTRQGAMPVTTYSPGTTSTTYHSGSVYSGGASGRYTGTSTTYQSGTSTTQYVPYAVNRYNYGAIFFAKFKPGILGIKVEEPDTEYMRKFDTRSGVKVVAVLKGGRAYKADIFVGDILISINGKPYFYEQNFDDWKFNTENIAKIYRNGEIMEKKIFVESE